MTWDGNDYGWGLPRERALTDDEQAERDRWLDEMDDEPEADDA